MFIQTIPAREFGGQRKRDFLSSPTPGEDTADEEAGIMLHQETRSVFLDIVANALVRNLLGAHHHNSNKEEKISSPPLNGEMAFILAENGSDDFYEKDCIPCKETYRKKHIVHREVLPYTAQKTSINI